MTKDEFNATFREYVRSSLSPTQKERDFVTTVYEHICKALNDKCIQIGSYPRFTSITPLHDLDVLYIIGDMKEFVENPSKVLSRLQGNLRDYFSKNTTYKLDFNLQTHSVTITFLNESNQEYFGIDVVPAFINGKNEFGLDTYVVPEIVKVGRSKRRKYYQTKSDSHSSIQWIKSDPRGYILIASNLNERNSDYRKAVKFAKKWKHSSAEKNEKFKLKSFHIEQVFVEIFANNQDISLFDAIFEFFCKLPEHIVSPRIKDRANSDIFIDEYLNELTASQKELIIQSRDRFLILLESFTSSSSVKELLNGDFYKRFSNSEAYLFDQFIPVFTESGLRLKVDGKIRKKNGFRDGWISEIDWKIETDRFIDFSIRGDNTDADIYKWKVKNNNTCPQPRGEITDHHTYRTPESTTYIGDHYVECYAIRNNFCVARSRINVHIG